MTQNHWQALKISKSSDWTKSMHNHKTLPALNACDFCNARAVCKECGRVFDLLKENDAQEWYYGHDCEA